jgi:RND family efflux transporter MFP subunit
MKIRQAVPTILIAATGALSGCSVARSEEADGAGDVPQAVPVRVQTAESVRRPRVITASGVVQASTEVEVAFQVPGKVVAVGPDEGSAVRAGELLAQIDPADYRLGLEQAAAQAERAAQERERFRPLLAAGSVAPNDFERIESGARQSAAAAGLARKRLADTRLAAPLSGVVARRAIEAGETAAPGQPVFTIVDVDPVRVRVGVPEAEVGAVRVGQRANVRLPALAGETFPGSVTLVGIAADPTTRSYAVEVSVPNPARRLRVGMVAEAIVYGAPLASAITVPAGAVVRDADGATLVYVLDARDSSVRARRVETGAPHGEGVEITRGLNAGEAVVVAGQQRVRHGSRVLPLPAADESRAEREGGAR